jgi:hypothetical protein
MSVKFVTDPEVHVVPSGGVVLPVIEDSGAGNSCTAKGVFRPWVRKRMPS